MKNKITVIGIVLTTIILAGVAIFTAIRLYQTRSTAVAPNVPSSKPAAAGEACNPLLKSIQCGKSGELCLQTGSDPSVGICGVPQPGACELSFSLSVSTPTSTSTATATSTSTSSSSPTTTSSPSSSPTATSTSSATATATATANPQCNYACTSNANCPSGLMCYIPSGSTTGNCRNTQCLTESDCTCAVATSTATVKPTAEASLPVVGTSWPTLVGTGFGILVIIGSLLLAL